MNANNNYNYDSPKHAKITESFLYGLIDKGKEKRPKSQNSSRKKNIDIKGKWINYYIIFRHTPNLEMLQSKIEGKRKKSILEILAKHQENVGKMIQQIIADF